MSASAASPRTTTNETRPAQSSTPPAAPAAAPILPAACMSNILPVNLEEHPASGRGRYSTVGVLEPVIRIERSSDPGDDKATATINTSGPVYRIITAFVLEVAIVGFDQGFQKHNRFFDALSLRYFYCRGDQIDLWPVSDATAHNLQVSRERDVMSTANAGISVAGSAAAAAVTPVLPTASVQVQRDFKLSYQRSMNSWRLGLSNGPAPSAAFSSLNNKGKAEAQPLATRLAAFLVPTSQQLRAPTEENKARFPPQDLQQRFFQVQSLNHAHTHSCSCRVAQANPCYVPPVPRYYDRAAHWSWQTEAALHLWTPEIYSVIRCPVTVMREVSVAEVDALAWGDEALQSYLHFDFDIDVQLRVLGVGLGTWLANLPKRGSRPAEMRAQSDTGQPLPRDHVRFSIACSCPETISWPLYPTRNLQEEAEAKALAADQVSIPRRLPTNAEFSANLLQQQRTANANTAVVGTITTSDQSTSTSATAPFSYVATEVPVPVPVPVPCRCQTLGPAQNRLYHCSVDCTAGHAIRPVRRPLRRARRITPLVDEKPYAAAASLSGASLPSSSGRTAPGISPGRSPARSTSTARRLSAHMAVAPAAQNSQNSQQFRRRTSLEKILYQERKRRTVYGA